MAKRYIAYTDQSAAAADLESRLVNYNTKAAGLTADSVFDDRTKLNTLVNVTMQPNGGDLDVIGVVRIGSAVTIPSNVRLRFVNGAYLAPDGGVTVTMNAMLAPTLRKIFGGGGVIAFSGSNVSEMYFEWWGTQGDGTDESVTMIAAIASLQASGGNLRCLNGKTYRADQQLLIPNDNGATPKQRSMRITGVGAATHAGQTGAMLGGATLDLRYAGGGVAAIDTRGLGTLEIDHLIIKDGANGSVPFIQTTNTTLKIHHNRFNGGKVGLACDKDAIVLGGTSTIISGGSNSPFQGYGTDINSNTFSGIRRGLYGRTYANAVFFHHNWFLHDCGTNLAFGAAIEFLGDPGGPCSGEHIHHNAIEIGAYPYGIKGECLVNSAIHSNDCYDPTATTIASVRFEANAVYNDVIDGYRSDTKPGISDGSTGGPHNTFRTSHQNQTNVMTEPHLFIGGVTLKSGSQGLVTQDANLNFWDWVITSAGGVTHVLRYTASGGGAEDVLTFSRASATDKRIQLQGSTNNQITAASQLRVLAAAGTALFLGDTVDQSVTVLNGQLRNTKATGTAPLVITSTTAVPNLCVEKVGNAAGTVGFYGVAQVARAGAIAAPTAPSAGYVQAEAASAKTAIDAIRTALLNIGITS